MTREPSAPKGPGGQAAAPAGAANFLRHTLPVGTQIGGLEITGLIGEGGFGIVYLAYDATLQRQVALKEYMPSSLASRSASSADVSVKSPRYIDTFAAGLRSFVNEARLLAHFDHPALVKVHQFWQANRTAYMVMPYYPGPTLKAHLEALAKNGQTPDEATLREWLAPLLDALELMHAEQCYHRDVAPDNILLNPNGPLLLDFGAARRVISDMTHALTVMLKPGYAPIEQYGDAASMAQGPWTDLYALGSVVYFAITGHSPITSVERVMGDPLPSLASVAAGRYSAAFLRAIDAALAVRPKDRPQSVAALRALLDGADAQAAGSRRAPAPPERSKSKVDDSAPPNVRAAGESAPGAHAEDGAAPNALARPEAVQPLPLPSVVARRPARRGLMLGLALAAAVGVGFTLAFMARRAGAPSPVSLPAAASVPAPMATPAPTLAGESAPAPRAEAPRTTPPGAANAPAVAPAIAPVVTPTATTAARPAATPQAKPALAPAASPPRAAAPRAARAVPAKPAASARSDSQSARPVPPAGTGPAPARATGTADMALEKAATPAARAEPVLPKAAPKPARCAEILQRGAQQPLSTDDVAFLRKECR